MPSDSDDPAAERNAAAGRSVAALGPEHQFLTLPNYVQIGSPTGDGRYIANPDFVLRHDQSFPLAKLVARASSGTVDPADGIAELDPIRNLDNRFPVWLTILGTQLADTPQRRAA